MWLLVGIRRSEVRLLKNVITFDIEDADIIGDAFDAMNWLKLLSAYGSHSFDAILTDGGLFGVERNDEIIRIKQKLLKEDGYVYNYSSVIGKKVPDPMGRGYTFYRIPKHKYTIENHEKAWETYKDGNKWQQLKYKVKLII
tara:strand:- start:429 stop:851 length:423 start_codon:yes stop_codon:yes gene_type:complete